MFVYAVQYLPAPNGTFAKFDRTFDFVSGLSSSFAFALSTAICAAVALEAAIDGALMVAGVAVVSAHVVVPVADGALRKSKICDIVRKPQIRFTLNQPIRFKVIRTKVMVNTTD